MKEDLPDDHAANSAVRAAVRQRLFRREAYDGFDLKRHVGCLALFRAWLEESAALARFPPHEWLVKRVAAALNTGSARSP